MAKVKACPLCGSNDLSWASGGSNAFLDSIGGTGIGLTVCNNCENQVMPVEFKNEAARRAYFQNKNTRPPQEKKEKGPDSNITQSKALLRYNLLLPGIGALIAATFLVLASKDYPLAAVLFFSGIALLFWTAKTYNGTKK
ncbi:MAG TPA: hypothetical protein VI874_03975 [Candidatus Norongarragalinales archaeon]|nr:hypothetical protein [Candidatus Norongarragalinales archaeon]